MARKKKATGAPRSIPQEEMRRVQQGRTSEIRRQAEEEYDYEPDDRAAYDEDLAAKRAGIGCLVAVLVVIGIIAGILLFGYSKLSGEMKGKNATATSTITMDVGAGAGAGSIAQQLKEQGMIGNDTIFRFYVRFGDAGADFQQGRFELTPGMSYDEIIGALSVPPPPRTTVKVTFPEGSTVLQFGAVLEKSGLCTAQEFVDEANKIENYSDIEFFSHIEFDPNTYMKAEGYLAPNTYEFFSDEDVSKIVRTLFEQFNTELEKLVFTSADGEEIGVYKKMEEREITLRDTVTLASLVEEEAGMDEHKADVAGVFWNRLKKEGDDVPRTMGSDVTFYYIRDFIAREYGGTYESVREQNPDLYYAYYTGDDSQQPRLGLPAGPISNPNITAIQSALDPTQSDYIFFLTDFYGKYYYGKALWEHEQNIATMNRENEKFEAESASDNTADGEADAAE